MHPKPHTRGVKVAQLGLMAASHKPRARWTSMAAKPHKVGPSFGRLCLIDNNNSDNTTTQAHFSTCESWGSDSRQ